MTSEHRNQIPFPELEFTPDLVRRALHLRVTRKNIKTCLSRVMELNAESGFILYAHTAPELNIYASKFRYGDLNSVNLYDSYDDVTHNGSIRIMDVHAHPISDPSPSDADIFDHVEGVLRPDRSKLESGLVKPHHNMIMAIVAPTGIKDIFGYSFVGIRKSGITSTKYQMLQPGSGIGQVRQLLQESGFWILTGKARLSKGYILWPNNLESEIISAIE